MKHKYLLILFALYFQIATSQDFEIENKISNSSIKGWNEWENLISEATLRGRVNCDGDNSFIKIFKIKSVEKVSYKTVSTKNYDTTSYYIIEYDTNGLLIKTIQHGIETIYNYDSNCNYLSSNTTWHAFVEIVGDVEILPDIEKRIYSPTFLLRKEFYLNNRSKPYKVFRYYYTHNLLDKIVIKEINSPQKEIIFRYTYFKQN